MNLKWFVWTVTVFVLAGLPGKAARAADEWFVDYATATPLAGPAGTASPTGGAPADSHGGFARSTSFVMDGTADTGSIAVEISRLATKTGSPAPLTLYCGNGVVGSMDVAVSGFPYFSGSASGEIYGDVTPLTSDWSTAPRATVGPTGLTQNGNGSQTTDPPLTASSLGSTTLTSTSAPRVVLYVTLVADSGDMYNSCQADIWVNTLIY